MMGHTAICRVIYLITNQLPRGDIALEWRAGKPCPGGAGAELEADMAVTINCDMGEAFGIYRMGDDEACMPYITHANIACGFHASDPVVMWRTVKAAKRHGISIGAHPGLPDREGFGRREMRLSREEVGALVLYQA